MMMEFVDHLTLIGRRMGGKLPRIKEMGVKLLDHVCKEVCQI